MKKIILKVKVDNPKKFAKTMADLEFNLSKPYWMHDRVYVPRNYKRGINLPRLIMRTEMRKPGESAKYSLILKRHIEDSGIDVSEITSINDYSEMVNIILQLGFERLSEVAKTRQKADLGDNVMLYFDKIDDKADGDYFAKIEAPLLEGVSAEMTKKDLKKIMILLDEENCIEKSYAEM